MSGLIELPRVLVTGSRNLNDPAPVHRQLNIVWSDLRNGPMVVVHGACKDRRGRLRGADRWAHEWAIARAAYGVEVDPHPADWDAYGKSAGPIRNAEMVTPGTYRCLAFPLGESRGTRGCIALAEKAGIPVVVTEGVPA